MGAWFLVLRLILKAFGKSRFRRGFGGFRAFFSRRWCDVSPQSSFVAPARRAYHRGNRLSPKSGDGSLRYTVQIRIKKSGMQVYQEGQTFALKQAAQASAKRRETELD